VSALTEKKKKEIEMLYRKMKEKPSRVLLNVFTDISKPNEVQAISKRVLNSLGRMRGIKYCGYTKGTNHISAMAQWTESEAKFIVAELKKDPGVANLQAQILEQV
jgi:hypothetical protein